MARKTLDPKIRGEAVAWRRAGEKTGVIAAYYEVDPTTIRQWCKAAGVGPPVRVVRSPDEDDKDVEDGPTPSAAPRRQRTSGRDSARFSDGREGDDADPPSADEHEELKPAHWIGILAFGAIVAVAIRRSIAAPGGFLALEPPEDRPWRGNAPLPVEPPAPAEQSYVDEAVQQSAMAYP